MKLRFVTRFDGRELATEASASASVMDLKRRIEEQTRVPSKRQTLVGLVKGRFPSDDAALGDLAFVRHTTTSQEEENVKEVRFTLVGTPDDGLVCHTTAAAAAAAAAKKEDDDDFLDFHDLDSSNDHSGGQARVVVPPPFPGRRSEEESESESERCDDDWGLLLGGGLSCSAFAETWTRANEAILASVAATLDINWMRPHRPGKPLLVLDLDHTLVDFDRRQGFFEKRHRVFPRPHLDHFLDTVHAHFDIVVWSQTSWRWVEVKLTELGLLGASSTKINFILDKSSTFYVKGHPRQKNDDDDDAKAPPPQHRVKALDVIWRRCDFWDRHNTVHVDDLPTNFALNPRAGLQCSPFHRENNNGDAELALLGLYLADVVAPSADFAHLDHNTWRPTALALYQRQCAALAFDIRNHRNHPLSPVDLLTPFDDDDDDDADDADLDDDHDPPTD